MTLPVKFLKDSRDTIEGLLMPFNGPIGGKDLDGEFFSPKTDFALNWYTERPLLYHHGLDADVEFVPVGKIGSIEIKKDLGGWMTAQLDRSSSYWEYIARLIDEGKLYLSSGALSHAVRKDVKTGEILRWPVVEGSLTPTPANFLAEVGYPAKLAALVDDLKAGRRFSSASQQTIRQAVAVLLALIGDQEMDAGDGEGEGKAEQPPNPATETQAPTALSFPEQSLSLAKTLAVFATQLRDHAAEVPPSDLKHLAHALDKAASEAKAHARRQSPADLRDLRADFERIAARTSYLVKEEPLGILR